jgi:hypothetical protein
VNLPWWAVAWLDGIPVATVVGIVALAYQQARVQMGRRSPLQLGWRTGITSATGAICWPVVVVWIVVVAAFDALAWLIERGMRLAAWLGRRRAPVAEPVEQVGESP